MKFQFLNEKDITLHSVWAWAKQLVDALNKNQLGGGAGEPGPAGPAGPKGDTGATGPAGPTGPTGATGPQGVKGDPGATGSTGAQGAAGATGPAGPGVATGGATNEVLAKVDATNFNTKWITLAGTGVLRGALVTKAADQTTANYTAGALIAWDAETYDTDNIHDNSTNNTRLTVPAGASYVQLSGCVTISSATSGDQLSLMLLKNGVQTFPGLGRNRFNTKTTSSSINITSAILPVTAGDYFELFLIVETDTSVTVAKDTTWFAMEIVERGGTGPSGVTASTMAQFNTQLTDGDFVYQNQAAALSSLGMSGALTMNGNTIYSGVPASSLLLTAGNAVISGGASIVLRGTASGYNDFGTEFYAGGVERMRLNSGGILDLYSGQLRFPAAQAASADPNTLDDYEEGSYTPTVTAGSGTFTSVAGAAYYTKVGRKVTLSFHVTITTNGTAASGVAVSLPFTSAASMFFVGSGREQAVTGAALAVNISGGSTILGISKYDNSYPGGNGYLLAGTVTYFV
jgi:hypothetical protein